MGFLASKTQSFHLFTLILAFKIVQNKEFKNIERKGEAYNYQNSNQEQELPWDTLNINAAQITRSWFWICSYNLQDSLL